MLWEASCAVVSPTLACSGRSRQTEPRSYSIGRLTRQSRQPFDINNISIGCYRFGRAPRFYG
jgi:hypothetical protein